MTGFQVLATADPERFRVLLAGRSVLASLPHHARRALGLHGTPPVGVAIELVGLLLEHGAWPDGDEVALLPAVGAIPGFADELRARLGP